ncbi:MAG: hypothetical protein ACHQJ7_04375, partial [Vicinamibacteria bacterium]
MSAPDATAPDPRWPSRDGGPADDPVDAIWDTHFRDPAVAARRAHAAIEDKGSDDRTRAWAEL